MNYWNMDLDINTYVDVVNFARARENLILHLNLNAEKYGTQGNTSSLFFVLYNQPIISMGKLIVLQGSWFTTIGIMERCIERRWGVARNGTGNLDGLP